jgi:hypothetical protein
MDVRLKIFAGYLTTKEKRDLVRSILEQQRKGPGISPEYSAYLEDVEKLLNQAEQASSADQPRRKRNRAASNN